MEEQKAKHNATNSKLYLFATIISAGAVLVANILAAKQYQIFGLAVSGGMLVFPITYILSDLISEVYGYKASRISAWCGIVLNVFAVTFFTIAIKMPYPDTFNGQNAMSLILGSTGRIFVASTLSLWLGGFVNDKLFEVLKNVKNNKFYQRAYISSIAGVAIDTVVFTPLAFIGKVPTVIMLQMMLTQFVGKLLYEAVILPFNSAITKRVKKYEENRA